MWLLLSCISAIFLGLYDVSKKKAVDGNAVLPTLFFATLSGAACTAPLILLSELNPVFAQQHHIYIPAQSISIHLLIIAKSFIVGTSWVLSYFALKHLPITIATPLRATAPLFTVLGAVVFFGERPTVSQWSGILLILTCYFIYSFTSRKNSATHTSPIWIFLMILAAITGAMSAGFDKYLLQSLHLPALFVLSYFLPYLTIILGVIVLIFWFPQRKKSTAFVFRPTIMLIGILLVTADLAYMTALSNPLAKLSIVSSIRRTNVIISFISGALLFHEGNIKQKLLPFAGILIGLILLMI